MKIQSCIFAFHLILFSTCVNAQGLFGGGSGTQIDPYILSDAANFTELSDSVLNLHDYTGVYFIVTDEIDFNNQNHKAIGGSTVDGYVPFNGIVDGQNHAITNCVVSYQLRNNGLFGEIGTSAVLKNIIFLSGSVTGGFYVGGIAGTNSGGTITGCSNGSLLSVTAYEAYAGGIVGFNGLNGEVSRCANHATVIGSIDIPNNAIRIGGICGGTLSLVNECFNTGAISGASYIGGILGIIDGNCDVSNCYNAGEISASDERSGGIAGGLMESFYCHIENCYNYGAVSGPAKIGAVCYFNSFNSTATNCHYDDVTSLVSDSHASPQTTSTMTGGSFSITLNSTTATCWVEDPYIVNNLYPVFGWQIITGFSCNTWFSAAPVIWSLEKNIFIRFTEPSMGVASLYNISGQLVYKEMFSSANHSFYADPDNVYLLLIETGKGRYLRKIFH